MIYISQGHQHSIGLEVLIKSFPLIPKKNQSLYNLVCKRQSLQETFDHLKITPAISDGAVSFSGCSLGCTFLESSSLPESTQSLLRCLQKLENDNYKGILLTLPTSKDQLVLGGIITPGHTEFFRKYFDNKSISMLFYATDFKVLLATDHIPVDQISSAITKNLIVDKVSTTVVEFKKFFNPFGEVLFSGINPHCGEEGLLGKEDIVITQAIEVLKTKYRDLKFAGPFSGDSLVFQKSSNKNQLFVYMYHDQGLSVFKSLYGFSGLNISLGMPFLRLSVDHGTSFNLYGKNQANFDGCLMMLKEAAAIYKNLNYEH